MLGWIIICAMLLYVSRGVYLYLTAEMPDAIDWEEEAWH